MPVILEANYSKKLGLPHYSSHQFSLTVKVEIGDLKQVPEESTRLYGLLQECVDHDLQEPGFLPEAEPNGHSHANGHGRSPSNGRSQSSDWHCTAKQRELILKIVEEHQLPKDEIERLAQDRFGKGVKALNKLEASGLIDELLEKHPAQREPARTPQRRTYQRTRA